MTARREELKLLFPVCLLQEIPEVTEKVAERGEGRVFKHASNNPRSTGKSLLRTCRVSSFSEKNGSQQRMKEATTVPASLTSNTNLEQKQRQPIRQGEVNTSEKSITISLNIANANVE